MGCGALTYTAYAASIFLMEFGIGKSGILMLPVRSSTIRLAWVVYGSVIDRWLVIAVRCGCRHHLQHSLDRDGGLFEAAIPGV